MEFLADVLAQREARQRAHDFIEFVRCLALTGGSYPALQLLETRLDRDACVPFRKALVPAMDTTSALVATGLSADWLTLALQPTILGQLDGKLNTVFGLTTPVVTAGPSTAWVGEGMPVPASALALAAVTLPPLKMSGIVAVSKELVRATDSRALTLLDQHLRVAVQRSEDSLLLDALAAVAQERPAGLLAGIVAVGDGSGDPGCVQAVWDGCRSGAPVKPYFIASPAGAVILASRAEAMYSECSPTGTGRLMGVPLLCSPAAGDRLALVDASCVVSADGGLDISAASAGAIQMDDAPQGSPATYGGPMTSLFQTNQVALRLTRYLNFALGIADAISYCALPVGSPY